MSAKTRLSPPEKLRIFLEALKDNVKVAEVCRREEIWSNGFDTLFHFFCQAMEAESGRKELCHYQRWNRYIVGCSLFSSYSL